MEAPAAARPAQRAAPRPPDRPSEEKAESGGSAREASGSEKLEGPVGQSGAGCSPRSGVPTWRWLRGDLTVAPEARGPTCFLACVQKAGWRADPSPGHMDPPTLDPWGVADR